MPTNAAVVSTRNAHEANSSSSAPDQVQTAVRRPRTETCNIITSTESPATTGSPNIGASAHTANIGSARAGVSRSLENPVCGGSQTTSRGSAHRVSSNHAGIVSSGLVSKPMEWTNISRETGIATTSASEVNAA